MIRLETNASASASFIQALRGKIKTRGATSPKKTNTKPNNREDSGWIQKLPAVKPPQPEQSEHASDHEAKLPLRSEGARLHLFQKIVLSGVA